MDFNYAIPHLKAGKHLARIHWEEHYSLACNMNIEGDNDVYVWIKNDLGENVIVNDGTHNHYWDVTAEDLQAKNWVMVIDFEIQHLNKLLKDPSLVKVTALQNKKYTVQYNGLSIYIYFAHELLNFCIKNGIEINIDIETECIMEFLQK